MNYHHHQVNGLKKKIVKKIENEKKLKNNYIEDNELNIKMDKYICDENQLEKVLNHRCSIKLKNQPFMEYYDNDKNRRKIEEYNMKVFMANCKMIVDADTKKSIKGIFKLETSRHIMNDFIFDLLDVNQHFMFKKMKRKCDKMMWRCEYDDIPDDTHGKTKEDNRELIQNQIKKFIALQTLDENHWDDDLLEHELMKTHK